MATIVSLIELAASTGAGLSGGVNFTGPENSFFAFIRSVGMSITTGPGRPLRAQWNPSAITSAISSMVRTSRLHLVSDRVTPKTSVS